MPRNAPAIRLIGPILVLLANLFACATYAQEELSDNEFDRLFLRWTYTLDASERVINDTEVVDPNLRPIRENLLIVRESASEARADAQRAIETPRDLLAALGPAPKEGEPAESEEIVNQRNALTVEIARFDARVKQSNIILARTEELLKRLSHIEYDTIAGVLGKRSAWPLAPATIVAGLKQIPERFADLGRALNNWWRFGKSGAGSLTNIGLFIAIVAIGIFLIERARRWAIPRYGRDPAFRHPSLARRFVAILVETLTRVVLPGVLIAVTAFFFIRGTAIPDEIRSILYTLVFSALQYVVVTGLSSTALSANRPQWRISSFTNDAAKNLDESIRSFVIVLLVINFVIAFLIPTGDRVRVGGILDLNFDKELNAVVGMVALIVIAVFGWRVFRGRNWRFEVFDAESETVSERRPWFAARLLLTLARGGLIVAVVFAVFGYLNFGIYLTARLAWSLALIAVAILIRGLIVEALRQATSEDNRVGRRVRELTGFKDIDVQRTVFWSRLFLDVVLLAVASGLLLLLWGVPWADLKLAAITVFDGVTVGNFSFSLTNVLLAIFVFGLLLIGIRFFKRFLSDRVLAQTTLDIGVRDAITTGVGYVGIVIAILIAISLLGLEFTKLALIFGALSVGIGFGLQHIVNNFISGVILLAQRPIKAGDWIVLGSRTEGYVKHISVISTEIQTFDNASVIVPNSQLVTSEVLNWMHKSNVGRATVSVGVAYDSDPEQIRDLLLGVLDGRDEVLKRPAPDVLFRDFGDSALVFELRFFLRDIDRRLSITSSVRYEIKRVFKEAGIVIPFPQRDIHLIDSAEEAVRATEGGPDSSQLLEVGGENKDDRKERTG